VIAATTIAANTIRITGTATITGTGGTGTTTIIATVASEAGATAERQRFNFVTETAHASTFAISQSPINRPCGAAKSGFGFATASMSAPKAVVRRINDYLSRGPRYFGAGEPSDQEPTGMTIVTGSYRRKVDVAGERMGDPLKPAAPVEIWSYATNGIT
jgi:hypothetical protein